MKLGTSMPVGQAVTVSFAIDQMAYRLDAGHRLRLALSNSYWPFVWPSPEQGCLTVTAGQLTLPVHQGSANEWTPPEPEHAAPWAHRVLRPGKTRRYIEDDLITGTRALIVEDDLGDAENLTHGLCTGETMSELWEVHPDDPLSARAVHTWEQRLSRGDWAVKTHAHAEMTATATHLHMKATLTAWEGDLVIFTADHGNDPTYKGTEHTRERVPVLCAGAGQGSIGLRGFTDVAASVAAHLGLPQRGQGESFL